MTKTEPTNASRRRKALLIGGGCYAVFIVYGSLVPLDFHPRPLDEAWHDFLAMDYLVLDVASRADWIANIVLYIPLAYLLSAGLGAGGSSGARRLMDACVIFTACAALALGVEFTQLFFPPRTVSLNDLIAEFLGSGLGIAIWLICGGALERLWTRIEGGGPPAIRAAIVVYVLAYLALSLFPYDFLVSAREFSERLAGGNQGLAVASGTCDHLSLCAAKFIAEIIAVAPLGVLLSGALGKAARHVYAKSMLFGFALGLAIELAQLFIASGIAEGMSVLTRTVGVSIGVALHRHVRWQSLSILQPYVVRLLLAATPPYLLALMWADGWFSLGWRGIGYAMDGIREVNWLPFYYHYFTTETHAVRSVLSVVGMYLPVGVGYWIWTLRRSYSKTIGVIPALIAGALAVLMETGKLFVPGKHPDPTDVLIAPLAAVGAYLVTAQVHTWALQVETPHSLPADTSPAAPATPAASSRLARMLASFLLLCGVAVAIWNYPLDAYWLALALGLYAAALWRYPGVCLPVVLGLLPALDLAPWSGWVLLNEFDLLIAVTLAVRLLRPHVGAVRPTLRSSTKWAIGLLATSFFTSAIVGLLPLTSIDQNTLVSYYGGLNSLRQLKGFAWALALLPLVIEEAHYGQRMERRLVTGMLIGLCCVVAVAVWERAVFSGLMDFAGEYRIAGPFPELHTGGGDIHAYLVMAIPFVAAWVALRPVAVRMALGAALIALGSYAIAVTFARGGYAGYSAAFVFLAVAAARRHLRRRTWTHSGMASAAALLVPSVVVMITIASGSFMETRMATTQTDARARVRHWAEALGMMDRGMTTALVGMGLGSFPKTVLVKDRDAASATFSYGREGHNGFVRLGSGKPLYLDQRVSVVPGTRYTLSLDLRSLHPKAQLDASLCEKSLQYSFGCKWVHFAAKRPGSGWEHHEATLNSDRLGAGGALLRRPVVLSLTNQQAGSVVDVDNVQLLDENGRDLIVNGQFSGGARWYFSTDDDSAWHIDNLYVQIFFEQGWLGVLAVAIVLLLSLKRLAVGMWGGEWFSGVLLASLCGFLVVGITDSLFDGPRVTTLFFLLLFSGLSFTEKSGQGTL